MKGGDTVKKERFPWKSFLQNAGVVLGAVAGILTAVFKILSCFDKHKESAA